MKSSCNTLHYYINLDDIVLHFLVGDIYNKKFLFSLIIFFLNSNFLKINKNPNYNSFIIIAILILIMSNNDLKGENLKFIRVNIEMHIRHIK